MLETYKIAVSCFGFIIYHFVINCRYPLYLYILIDFKSKLRYVKPQKRNNIQDIKNWS